MLKGKRAKRTFENRGIRWYSFDFQLERTIYRYLCCDQMKEKELNKLDENLRFESYHQWKQYICNKYKNYDKEKLLEFSRYLNQGKRKTKPSNEYWNLLIPCLLTISLSIPIDMFFDLIFEEQNISVISLCIVIILTGVNFVMAMFYFIKTTYAPIKENNINLNMYTDYKEIIDGIISENSEHL